MPNLSFGGKTYTVNHAVKGPDYIHGYNAAGTLLIAFDGVSDFSGFSYNGTYMDPTECATEGCNGAILVGGALKTKDGRDVTAADVGAAPAGYGLGGAVATVAHPDEAVETGFYAVNNDAVMPANHWWVGYVTKYVDGYAVQHFTRLVTGEKIQRYMDNGEWQPWEWENPHVYDGNEYRTTERHNGKTVYAKIINAETLPANNFKDIWFSAEATEIVDLRVVAHSGAWTNVLPLFGDDGIRTVYASRFNHNIRIYSMRTDSSGSTGTIYVKYTKD